MNLSLNILIAGIYKHNNQINMPILFTEYFSDMFSFTMQCRWTFPIKKQILNFPILNSSVLSKKLQMMKFLTSMRMQLKILTWL